MLKLSFLVTAFFMMCCSLATAQCPLNIGFNTGDFTNWTGYTGLIDSTGNILMTATGITLGRHTLIGSSITDSDQYGKFPLVSPNNNPTFVRLGNDIGGAQAERLTYTFTVPANITDYTLIYYYAVVLENPNHLPYQQPKFTANVYDVAAQAYAVCGSYTFVAAANLPGFQSSPFKADVLYKPWQAVTINLAGYQGKTLRLEFTTNDCSLGGHFGYAYFSINQYCGSPITGNVICNGTNGIALKGPPGFEAYYWYKSTDLSTVLATAQTYTTSPAPAPGTQYSLRIIPYPGVGCEDTVTTTIQSVENLAFNVVPQVSACGKPGADITKPYITAGSDSTLVFSYYSDAPGGTVLENPTSINTTGTYYIKANTPGGCFYIKPILVTILPTPALTIANPAETCHPWLVDITVPAVTGGGAAGDMLSYWTDALATQSLPHPDKISNSGTYYIKAVNSIGCYDIEPVTVLIDDLPVLTAHNVTACTSADIAGSVSANVTGLRYTYWLDSAATIPLANPTNITKNGTYYVEATTPAGCTVVSPVSVTIYNYPQLTVTNPQPFNYPATVDITQTFVHQAGTSYAYYADSLGTHPLTDPASIGTTGTYYIKATNNNLCSIIAAVKVTAHPPPPVNFSVNTFTPNGDGVNDVFHIKVPVAIKFNSFSVYGPWGGLIFQTTDANKGWDGTMGGNGGSKLPVGTYYWIFDAYDNYNKVPVKQSGSVTIVL